MDGRCGKSEDIADLNEMRKLTEINVKKILGNVEKMHIEN